MRTRRPKIDACARAQGPATVPSAGPVQRPLRIRDLDGALRELGDRGPGLALLVDGDGRPTEVAYLEEPIPYAMALDFDDVERGAREEEIGPGGLVS